MKTMGRGSNVGKGLGPCFPTPSLRDAEGAKKSKSRTTTLAECTGYLLEPVVKKSLREEASFAA